MTPFDKETNAKILAESPTFRDWVAERITPQPEDLFIKVLEIAKSNSYKKIPTIKAIREQFQSLPPEADMQRTFPRIDFTTWRNSHDFLSLADTKQLAEIFIK